MKNKIIFSSALLLMLFLLLIGMPQLVELVTYIKDYPYQAGKKYTYQSNPFVEIDTFLIIERRDKYVKTVNISTKDTLIKYIPTLRNLDCKIIK